MLFHDIGYAGEAPTLGDPQIRHSAQSRLKVSGGEVVEGQLHRPLGHVRNHDPFGDQSVGAERHTAGRRPVSQGAVGPLVVVEVQVVDQRQSTLLPGFVLADVGPLAGQGALNCFL